MAERSPERLGRVVSPQHATDPDSSLVVLVVRQIIGLRRWRGFQAMDELGDGREGEGVIFEAIGEDETVADVGGVFPLAEESPGERGEVVEGATLVEPCHSNQSLQA
jgi:hypothetical protein